MSRCFRTVDPYGLRAKAWAGYWKVWIATLAERSELQFSLNNYVARRCDKIRDESGDCLDAVVGFFLCAAE